jgi:hypothetical protein
LFKLFGIHSYLITVSKLKLSCCCAHGGISCWIAFDLSPQR